MSQDGGRDCTHLADEETETLRAVKAHGAGMTEVNLAKLCKAVSFIPSLPLALWSSLNKF